MSFWRDWTLAVGSALSVYAAEYWQGAPGLMRIAAMALGPLLLLECVSASWMQREARRPQAEAIDVLVYPEDTWQRGGRRFALTLLLICLGAGVDAILGTPHMTVLWVLLWGTSGHARATLRHLEAVARLNHMELPIFPNEKIERMQSLAPGQKPGQPGGEKPDGA